MTPDIIAAIYTVSKITSTLDGSLAPVSTAALNVGKPSATLNGAVVPTAIDAGTILIPIILDVEGVAE